MDCPVCKTQMIKAQATQFGEEYDYCRVCKKELKELEKSEDPFSKFIEACSEEHKKLLEACFPSTPSGADLDKFCKQIVKLTEIFYENVKNFPKNFHMPINKFSKVDYKKFDDELEDALRYLGSYKPKDSVSLLKET
jgi:hypothetical protein